MDMPARAGSREFDLDFTVRIQDRTLVDANTQGRRVLGISSAPVPLDAVLDADDIAMLGELQAKIIAGDAWTGTLRLRPTALGQRKLQAVVVAHRPVDLGNPTLSVTATELTKPDQVLAELAHRATHDYLTGLPNRALLLDRLSLTLARSRRNARPVALMFIDLDDFKQINDTQGHSVGDGVLVQAAAAMPHALRPSDTIARMGGDEFVILCGEITDPSDAQRIAERVCSQLGTNENPHTHRPVTASIGVAVSLSGDIDSETLIAAADRAMYEAKATGAGQISMRTVAEADFDIVPPPGPEAIREALTRGELLIGATPVIDIRSGMVAQIEVAPMWQGYTGTRYPARELIDLTAHGDQGVHAGISHHLDIWSLQAATNTYRFLTDHYGARAPRVTTTISVASPLDSHLATVINDLLLPHLPALSATPGGPGWNALGLEFDEAALMQAAGSPTQVLDRLDDLGVALAVNGYGTGSIPLAWLAGGAVRAAKIDRDLAEIGDGVTIDVRSGWTRTESVFDAAVRSAHALGLAVVATNITSHAQLEHALYVGCDGAQGALFGQNVDPVALATMLEGRYAVDFW